MVLPFGSTSLIPEDVSAWSGAEQELSERLESFPMDTLRRMTEEPERINSIVDDLEVMKGLERHKRICKEKNARLANSTLGREKELAESKRELARIYAEAQTLTDRYKELLRMHESICCDTSQEMSWIRIQSTASSFDTETELEAENVLRTTPYGPGIDEQQISVFLSSYVTKRKLCHLLKAKSERLAAMIRESGGFSFM